MSEKKELERPLSERRAMEMFIVITDILRAQNDQAVSSFQMMIAIIIWINFGVITIVSAAMKLDGAITWPWWVVWMPLLGCVASTILIVINKKT
jgi:hypothetical protein